MLKNVLIFVGGLAVGALGATYLAGIEEGRREAQRFSFTEESTDNADSDDNLGDSSTAPA